MLVANRLFQKIYGPYRKRYDERLVVTGNEAGDIRVSQLPSGKIQVSAPVNAKIETQGVALWKTVFDGSKLMLGANAQNQELEFPADAIIRVTPFGKGPITIGVQEDRPAISIMPSKQDLAAFVRFLGDTLQSSVLHAVLIAILFYANSINLYDMMLDPTKLEEVAKKEEQIEMIPVDLTAIQADSDFGGKSVSPTPGSSNSQEMSEKRAEKITQNLSNLIGKISGIRLPNINGNMIVSAVNKDGGSHALAAKLSQGKNAAVSGNLKMLNSGKAGDSLRWQLYSTVGHEVSLRDQEQVVELFKALQPSFRACYDNALLKDEDLSVTVQYEAEVVGDGRLGSPRYSVVGKSTPQSENDLTSCISRVLNKGKVSKSLSGVKIKNEFIFRS